jgi:hypothetical protein
MTYADIDKLIDVLDEAIMSDDPRVQDCLKKLLVVVALTNTDQDRSNPGPLRQLWVELHAVSRRVQSLKTIEAMRTQSQQHYGVPTWQTSPTTVPNTPSWVVGGAGSGVWSATGTGTAPNVVPVFKDSQE